MIELDPNIKYGRLTIIERVDKTHYKFRCDCGSEVVKLTNSVKTGNTRSCGCLMKDSCRVDLSGRVYGSFTVLAHVTGRKWSCRCKCGEVLIIDKRRLFKGWSLSCGCGREELIGKDAFYRGNGKKTTRTRVNHDWHVIRGTERIKMKSSYEVIYAQYLIRNHVSFSYEPKRFVLVGGDYVPDFYLPEEDLYVECKGVMTKESASRIERFERQTGNKIHVIGEEEIEGYLPRGMSYFKFMKDWKKTTSLYTNDKVLDDMTKLPVFQKVKYNQPIDFADISELVAFMQHSNFLNLSAV